MIGVITSRKNGKDSAPLPARCSAILLAAHRVDGKLLDSYRKLQTEAGEEGDVFLLLETEDGNRPKDLPQDIRCFPFSVDGLNGLGFEPLANYIVPGSNHFPLWLFREKHPDKYRYYWNVEYDVRFTGDWGTFFGFFREKEEDFISTHLQSREECPEWARWGQMHGPGSGIPCRERLKAFNPIYRISDRALAALQEPLRNGLCGHHELLLPTWLHHRGFPVADLGGAGRFTYPEARNRFYTPCDPQDSWYQGSTMRYRPVYAEGETILPAMLYHPVK